MRCPKCGKETLLIKVHWGNDQWMNQYFCAAHGVVKEVPENGDSRD